MAFMGRLMSLCLLVIGSFGASTIFAQPLYETCAACHGADGGGVADGSIPAIGGQPAAVIAAQLRKFRSGSREDLRMQHFSNADHLRDEAQLLAVAAHVASLRRKTPVAHGSGDALESGRSDFERSCASCHGAQAAADAKRGMMALAGQHAPYLLRKMREASSGEARGIARSHGALLSRLPPARQAAIADYLSRMPVPAPLP